MANAGITVEKVENSIKSLRKNETIDSETMDDNNKLLENYTIDITSLAKQGKLDPVIGREEEIKKKKYWLNKAWGKKNWIFFENISYKKIISIMDPNKSDNSSDNSYKNKVRNKK